MDYGRYDPVIDTTAFPNTPTHGFWSSTSDAGTAGKAWDVYFKNGNVSHYNKGDRLYARCVRLGPATLPEQRFIQKEYVQNQPVVMDMATGLMWEKQYVTGKTWRQALAYCEGLDYGGFDDWRLPNINELRSLINYAKHDPASDFPDMPSDYLWSSTSNVVAADYAWAVVFSNGNVQTYNKGNEYTVRCVRSGPYW